MSPRERRAADFLKKLGLVVKKRPEGAEKSPDFDVTASDGFYFLSETKAVVGGENEPLLWQELYNAITSDIREAAKQFDSVNSTRLVPNVLILVSEDFRFREQSFIDFLKGEIIIEGKLLADLRRYRLGRVKPAFSRIDLFLLLDKGNTPSLFFVDNDPRFLVKLRAIFHV